MDAQTISIASASIVLGTKITGNYLQSRFPSAKSSRLIHIPTTALSALSFGIMGHDKGAVLYGGACIRSTVRSTDFGKKHGRLVGIFMSAGITGYTALTYRDPTDLLPLASFIIGTIGDTSAQGRYYKLFVALALGMCAAPYAFLKENYVMGGTEMLATAFFAKGIYQHDIKGASGTKSVVKDIKAYLHGIFRNSATGASVEGQISSDLGKETYNQQFTEKLKSRPNPYFEPASTMA